MTTSKQCTKATHKLAINSASRLSRVPAAASFQVVEDWPKVIDGADPQRLDDPLPGPSGHSHKGLDIRILHLHGDHAAVFNRARCTCAIDAAATGSCSMSAKCPPDVDAIRWRWPSRFRPRSTAASGPEEKRASGCKRLGECRPRGGELTTLINAGPSGDCVQHAVHATLMLPVPVPRLHQRQQPFRPSLSVR